MGNCYNKYFDRDLEVVFENYRESANNLNPSTHSQKYIEYKTANVTPNHQKRTSLSFKRRVLQFNCIYRFKLQSW